MSFACDISRQVIRFVRILPNPLDVLALRVYNKAFKMLAGNTHTARAYFGSIFACDIDDLIQRTIFYFGIWEPMISHLTEQILREGDVYVDMGANIGYDSLLASKRVGRSGKIVSIEASPKICALLSDNVTINGVSNIRIINKAVSDRGKLLAIYGGGSQNIGKTTTIEARGLPIECCIEALPIEEILTPDEINRVRLFKIDIEGAELLVLNHLLDTLSKYPEDFAIIVEASVHENPREWTNVFRRMQEAGFVAFEIENRYELDWYIRYQNHSPVKLTKTLPNGRTDILFIRTALVTAVVGPPNFDLTKSVSCDSHLNIEDSPRTATMAIRGEVQSDLFVTWA